MKFIIIGKNIDVTPGLREAVESKLGKLGRYFTPNTEIHVTLSVQKGHQKIEVTIPVKGGLVRSEQESSDMYVSIDLVEEFRAIMCDRFVISLINKRIINNGDFEKKEDGAVLLSEDGRKVFLTHWQNRKQDIVMHPFLKEKVEWGLLPYIQALLLSRYIRGDLDEYPMLLWR